MKIEFDSRDLQPSDMKVFRALDGEMQVVVDKLTRELNEMRGTVLMLRQRILELESQSAPVKIKHGKLKDLVREAFDGPDAIYTVAELAQKIGHDKPESVYQTCYVLVNEGLLDQSHSRPIKFFLRASGNPELRDAVPAGTKVSYMG